MFLVGDAIMRTKLIQHVCRACQLKTWARIQDAHSLRVDLLPNRRYHELLHQRFLKPKILGRPCNLHALNSSRKTCSTHSCPRPPPETTVDSEEIHKFSSSASDWHGNDSPYRALRAMNRLRVPFIRNGLSEGIPATRPLEGLAVLDVGCGGGLLSLPLARLGADITAIDMSVESIDSAKQFYEQGQESLSLEFRVQAVEQLVEKEAGKFDALVASEVIEHVNSPALFVEKCVEAVKPGGSLFFTSISKTVCSKLLVVLAAEYIFNVVPKGTHQWEKFITPAQLSAYLEQYGCSVRKVHGMSYNVLTGRWSWCDDSNINYALHAIKSHASTVTESDSSSGGESSSDEESAQTKQTWSAEDMSNAPRPV